jgi:hypothetical protein
MSPTKMWSTWSISAAGVAWHWHGPLAGLAGDAETAGVADATSRTDAKTSMRWITIE